MNDQSRGNHDSTTAGGGNRKSLTNDDIIDVFSQSMSGLTGYLRPIMGDTTVDAILLNSVRESVEQYSFLSSLELSSRGVSVGELKRNCEDVAGTELLAGIMYLIQRIISILTLLTGDILTRKAKKYLEELNNTAEEGSECAQ